MAPQPVHIEMSAVSSDGRQNEDIEQTSTKRPTTWRGRLNPLKARRVPPIPSKRNQKSPESSAGPLSKAFFSWFTPLIHLGYQRTLETNDIWLVNPRRSVTELEKKFGTEFERRVSEGTSRPLLGALYATFKRKFLLGGLFQLIVTAAQVSSAYLLKYVIVFAAEAFNDKRDGKEGPEISRGVGLVVLVTALQIVMTLCTNHFLYLGLTVGGEARAVLMSRIFSKSLTLSGRARAGGPTTPQKSTEKKKKSRNFAASKEKTSTEATPAGEWDEGWTNGRIVNLCSTETSRIDQASSFFHLSWSAPLSVIVIIILLLINIGYSALPGLGVLFLSIVLLGKATGSLFARRRNINTLTEKRVSLISEALQSIRFIKLFNWESSFLERLEGMRKKEVKSIQILLVIRDAIQSFGIAIPVFGSMVSFITYASTGHGQFDPATIFSSLALFNQMRFPLTIFPVALGQIIDAVASVQRVQEFLLAEEESYEVEEDYGSKNAIVVNNATFTWEQTKPQQPEGDSVSEPNIGNLDTSSTPFQIQDLNLTIGRSDLVGVIGNVGSGKSSLLAALAGEMRKTAGSVRLGARRAFCPQYAWLQNSSVRDNITFGKEFEPELYDRVTEACALRADFDMLPHGDATEIGERGITVSGGQKQRINIARAIYFNADVLLLDDPLSAVDAHVGRHIMDKAICGLLADKCRILATHSLHVLHKCDKIVWLENGRVKVHGTFPELMDHNQEFVDLMRLGSHADDKAANADAGGPPAHDLDANPGNAELPKNQTALMQAEERAVNAISWDVYRGYLEASGTRLVAVLVIFLLVISQAAYICTGLWLSWWTAGQFPLTSGGWIGIYASLGVAQTVALFAFYISVSLFGTRASRSLFRKAVAHVLGAPMSFFDTTPLGRITNRFTRDIDVTDNKLTESLRMYLMTIGNILATFALIVGYFHFFIVALVPLLTLYFVVISYYHASAREIKRHEALQRSHVVAKFSEAIYGVATIRAYGVQSHFIETIRRSIDEFDGAYFLSFANQCWLGIRLDAVGLVMIFIIGILIVTSRFSVHPSIGGLVLSYMLSIINLCSFALRQMAEVESDMNSTERLHYYGTSIEQESPAHIGQLPPAWPQHGEICFQDVHLRYRPGLPLVLKGINIQIKAGERIGIVGRTGSGKSTILQALFRMVEVSAGSIVIDGIDISKIGLADLRSRIAIIPQDPALFQGTVRSNLDPLGKHEDQHLLSAMERAGLSEAYSTGEITLESVVEEEGLNFSLGQRQLLALARALLKESNIIVCDEATSSIDLATDKKVQQTLSCLKGRTFLCIAHRLSTIIGYDRICVMDQGQVAELDSPPTLYSQGGLFRRMCDRSGIKREDILQAKQFLDCD